MKNGCYSRVSGKIREIFDGLGRNQKIGGGAGIGVLLLLIIFMSSGGGGDDVVYRPLHWR